MPLDYRIPLMIGQQAGAALQGGESPDLALERRERVQTLQEQRRKMIEDAQDRAALTQALQVNGGDVDAAQQWLMKAGRFRPANVLGEAVQKARKATAEEKDATLKSQEAANGLVAQLAQGGTRDNWHLTKPIINSIDPTLGARLPDEFDQGAVDAVVTSGLKPNEFFTQKRDALKLYGEGKITDGMAKDIYALPHDPTDADMADIMQNALDHGASAADVATVRNLPTAEAKAWAKQRLISPEKAAELAGQAESRQQTGENQRLLREQAAANAAATEANRATIDAREQQRLAMERQRLGMEGQRRLEQSSTDATGKAYNVSKNRLDNLRKPLADAQARMSRLVDTVNQATPQADALIAEELLTIMAGGMGSGLRINEAALQRVIGGRSNLEGLKAALNKWQTDPSKALSVTPAQRQQIRALIQTVGQKANDKINVIQQADNDLLEAKTVDDQRRIIVKAQRDVEDIGGTAAGAGGPKEGTEAPVPGHPGVIAVYRGGKWIVK